MAQAQTRRSNVTSYWLKRSHRLKKKKNERDEDEIVNMVKRRKKKLRENT